MAAHEDADARTTRSSARTRRRRPSRRSSWIPGDGNGTREIGVAILPGGVDGSPTSSAGNGSSCARITKPTDSAPIGAYASRQAVRCWGGGSPPASTDTVNGRSVAIVRVDTGEILRVFARQTDVMTKYPSDTLLTANRIIDTPLDSPMTGTPLVYPSDVGTDATKVFVSDADGTMWRFDVSNPDPSKWTGEHLPRPLQPDGRHQPDRLVRRAAALGHADDVARHGGRDRDQRGDGRHRHVRLDRNRVRLLDHREGAGQHRTGQKLRAFVNWYMGTPLTPASTFTPPQTPERPASSPAFLAGERVSGPMVVFDGKLYFATYAVPPPSTVTCISNLARIWGVDFVHPADTTCNLPLTAATCNRAGGGVPGFLYQSKMETDITPYATAGDARLRTAVIPGLTINATPACAGAGVATTDQYVGGGAQHTAAQNLATGKFQLSSQVGAPGANGTGTATMNLNVPTPLSPTVIDSWAAVLE